MKTAKTTQDLIDAANRAQFAIADLVPWVRNPFADDDGRWRTVGAKTAAALSAMEELRKLHGTSNCSICDVANLNEASNCAGCDAHLKGSEQPGNDDD